MSFHSHQVLKPALVPALDKGVDLTFLVILDVLAMRQTCCHVTILAMYGHFSPVDIIETQEFIAKVC